MKRFFYITSLLLLTILPSVKAQGYLETADCSQLVGTWKYEHADTTFTIYLTTTKEIFVSGRSINWLTGSYRLKVKGKFDDNHIVKSKIPKKIYQKYDQKINPSTGVYLQGVSRVKDSAGLDYYEARIPRTDKWLVGITIKRLSNGTLEWRFVPEIEDRYRATNGKVCDYRMSAPKYALLHKID